MEFKILTFPSKGGFSRQANRSLLQDIIFFGRNDSKAYNIQSYEENNTIGQDIMWLKCRILITCNATMFSKSTSKLLGEYHFFGFNLELLDPKNGLPPKYFVKIIFQYRKLLMKTHSYTL